MKFLTWIVCVASMLLVTSAYSQQDEAAKLDATIGRALDVLYLDAYQEYSYEQQQVAVQELLEQSYDLTIIIRRALARNWNLLSEDEQVQVKELIEQLIVKVYVEGMEGQERPTIVCAKPIEITTKRMEIPVVISFPDGDIFNVVYRFGRLKTGWEIYDIVAEDVSIVSNYRQQFDDHFRKGNGQQLIEKLQDLLKQDKLDADTKL